MHNKVLILVHNYIQGEKNFLIKNEMKFISGFHYINFDFNIYTSDDVLDFPKCNSARKIKAT